MNGVVGANQNLRAGPDQLGRRLEQHRADSGPFVAIDQPLIFTPRKVMQRDLGVRVWTEQRRAFEANRPIAKRGPLRADGHDADMFHHTPLVMLHAAAVGRFDVPTATPVRGCDVSAAARGFECSDLLRMLPLKGLHLFRVLSL
jgi:hypothetical protein